MEDGAKSNTNTVKQQYLTQKQYNAMNTEKEAIGRNKTRVP